MREVAKSAGRAEGGWEGGGWRRVEAGLRQGEGMRREGGQKRWGAGLHGSVLDFPDESCDRIP